jgi:HK97 family phage portal protein
MIQRIFDWLEKRAQPRKSSDPYLSELFGLRESSAGVPVTTDTVEGLSAVYACVGLIAESVARLPLHVYRLGEDSTRERQRRHYIEKVLNGTPNSRNTAFELKECLVQHLLMRGNGFAEIKDNARGEVTSLEIMHPDLTGVEVLENGRLRYTYSDPYRHTTRVLTQDQVLHIRGRSDDGISGKTPIRVARDTLGLALAEREHGSATFRNGTRLSGILHTDNKLSQEAIERIKEGWGNLYSGVGNYGKTPVLDAGLKFQQLSMNNEDAQWIAARRFSFEEVARLFRVPPVLIGDLTNANYSNSVEMMRYFLVTCLSPHLRRFEEAVERCMLSDVARNIYFVEFESKALVQADIKTRYEAYGMALDPQKGWMEKNEVRRAENLPPMQEQEPAV